MGDKTVELTATEFDLVLTMARRPGQVFTRSQLLDAVHGVAFESYERAIDAHVKNIRRKLEPDRATPVTSRRSTASAIGSPMPDRRSRHGLPVVAGGEGWPPSSASGPWRSWRRRAIWLAVAGVGALILVWSVAGFFFGGGGRPGRGFFPGSSSPSPC